MNCYIFVPTVSLTQAMKNRSVQPFISKTVTISAVEYTILEVSRDDLILTDVFDGYTWYSIDDARYIKENEAWPS